MSGKRRRRGRDAAGRRTPAAGKARSAAASAGGDAVAEDAARSAAPPTGRPARRRPALRHRLLLIALGLLLPVLALAGLELVLRALDVGGAELYDDPFVGFAPGSDLFAPRTLPDGRRVWATRPEKLAFFNEQSFAYDKPADGYRVFALGGSTTAGRPYDAEVAFARWLERYLDSADPSRTWEVVNAGAISYASYRVVVLMQELVRYEPDLFVVYTGHNEFLERRSYSDLVDQPELVKRARTWISRFRFAALARRAARAVRGDDGDAGASASAAARAGEAGGEPAGPTVLAGEVDALLDAWTGLERYERDDELARSVVEHFEFNLEQMVNIARDHGAAIVFVEPVENLKDFSPFKPEPTPGLDAAARARAATLLARGEALLAAGEARAALAALAEAREIDPRHAEVRFRLGRAHLALGDRAAADAAFRRARDEDVAPLRAIGPIHAAVRRVAARRGVPLVDLPRLLAEAGHPIPGDEVLLDHVHPDVPVHGLIAERVLDEMIREGVVDPRPGWGPPERRAIFDRVVAGLDREYYARRDLNLSKVLGWAGKYEEAATAVARAAEALPDEPEVHLNLGWLLQREGRLDEAIGALDRAAALAPDWPTVRFTRGLVLGKLGRAEEAIAELEEAIRLRPGYAEAHHDLGALLRERGRPGDLERAAEEIARAAEIVGPTPESALAMGLVLRRQGRLAEAEAAFRRALAHDPEDAAVRTALGVTLARRGRLEKARAELARAAELDPADPEARYNLGLVLARGGDAAGAEAAYRRALELAPRHPEAHNNLGILLAGRGEVGAALPHLERAAELAPGWAEAWFNLGVARENAGRVDAALDALERAVGLEPENARFRLALGSVYAARGDARRALPHLEAARAGGQPVPADLLARLRSGA